VVVARALSGGDSQLVAYVVDGEKAAAGDEELKEFLRKELPDYMVPALYVRVSAIPLTTSGKADRQALQKMEAPGGAGREHVAPGTAVEEVLAEIWSEVLGVEVVGVTDNFFELGGHSLKATQVVARIREALQADVPVRSLFEFPTVSALASVVSQNPSPAKRIIRRIAPVRAVESKDLSEDELNSLLERLLDEGESHELR
jgi:acyl carrier protein